MYACAHAHIHTYTHMHSTAFSISIVVSFPLMIFPVRASIYSLLFSKVGYTSGHEMHQDKLSLSLSLTLSLSLSPVVQHGSSRHGANTGPEVQSHHPLHHSGYADHRRPGPQRGVSSGSHRSHHGQLHQLHLPLPDLPEGDGLACCLQQPGQGE